ncbi:hypothetical protein FYJ75_10230 [Roseburia sp. MUC/MUC-530-WT-4D]|uniref:Uncharacterized protein n=1 Tax=Roseburia porci TaxID=2605790 RepID=A0A6L5YSG8_9FIRM|nr:hypothetical protein [Roseburia porci]
MGGRNITGNPDFMCAGNWFDPAWKRIDRIAFKEENKSRFFIAWQSIGFWKGAENEHGTSGNL